MLKKLQDKFKGQILSLTKEETAGGQGTDFEPYEGGDGRWAMCMAGTTTGRISALGKGLGRQVFLGGLQLFKGGKGEQEEEDASGSAVGSKVGSSSAEKYDRYGLFQDHASHRRLIRPTAISRRWEA